MRAADLGVRLSDPAFRRVTLGDSGLESRPGRVTLGPREQALLDQWRRQLQLSGREQSQLAGQLLALDRQLGRLQQRSLRVAVFGRVGVGKSSLLNALLGEAAFATDVAHGCTRHQQAQAWAQPMEGSMPAPVRLPRTASPVPALRARVQG